MFPWLRFCFKRKVFNFLTGAYWEIIYFSANLPFSLLLWIYKNLFKAIDSRFLWFLELICFLFLLRHLQYIDDFDRAISCLYFLYKNYSVVLPRFFFKNIYCFTTLVTQRPLHLATSSLPTHLQVYIGGIL